MFVFARTKTLTLRIEAPSLCPSFSYLSLLVCVCASDKTPEREGAVSQARQGVGPRRSGVCSFSLQHIAVKLSLSSVVLGGSSPFLALGQISPPLFFNAMWAAATVGTGGDLVRSRPLPPL